MANGHFRELGSRPSWSEWLFRVKDIEIDIGIGQNSVQIKIVDKSKKVMLWIGSAPVGNFHSEHTRKLKKCEQVWSKGKANEITGSFH